MNSLPRQDLESLVEAYRSYAHALAAEVKRKLPAHVDRADIESAAELGLVEAARAFDPGRGVLFKTFAYYRIRGAIFDYLRKVECGPGTEYRRYRFEAAANEYVTDYTSSTIVMGSPEEEYLEIENVTGSVLSSYLLAVEQLGGEPADDRSSPEAALERREESERVREALSRLPEKNRQVVEGYYFQELSMEEIGQKLGLSKSWVSRLHAKGLDLMRDFLRERSHKLALAGETSCLEKR
jgi:RNA polymerase sigma factor FliA